MVTKINYLKIKHNLIVLIYCLICSSIFSQNKIYIFSQKTDSGFTILANNDEVFPVSVSINFELTNLIPTSTNRIFALSSKSKNNFILNLNFIDAYKPTNFSVKFNSYLGDVLTSKQDINFVYELPFEKNNSFKLHQGYNGSFSHQNENSLDFTMPIGTKILAARSGIIIEKNDTSRIGCANINCIKYSNYVTILHNDGTYARYAHIDFKGVKVNIGDTVQTGQLIALSGNTGFSSGPHLHFVCYLPNIKEIVTLETKFRIDDGSKSSILTEGNYFSKNY